MKYAVIEEAAGEVSVRKACELLDVRRQGYYEYRERKDSVRKVRDRALKTKIQNIFYESDRIYGARKIRAQLRKGGDDVSRKHVRRLMDEAGLVPVTWRKRVQTTVSDPQAKPFCNLLKQDFKVALPNLTWVSDFTYVPTDEGWLYVCSFVDLFSRRVVGWESSDTIDRNLAIAAFRISVENRRPGKHLVIHTDRGCQYTSWDFRREVAAIGGIQSMSRPGTPYDNACAETFFKTLKTECVERHHFKTRKEARDTIAKYILFYNRVRIHQSLGYLTPVEFENILAA